MSQNIFSSLFLRHFWLYSCPKGLKLIFLHLFLRHSLLHSSKKSQIIFFHRRSQWCAIAFGLGGVGRGASVTSGLRNDSRLFEWPRTARGKVRAEAYSKTRLLSWGDVVKNVPKPVCYTFDLWEEGRGVSATPGLQNDSRLFEGPRVACRKVHLEARSKTWLLSWGAWQRGVETGVL